MNLPARRAYSSGHEGFSRCGIQIADDSLPYEELWLMKDHAIRAR